MAFSTCGPFFFFPLADGLSLLLCRRRRAGEMTPPFASWRRGACRPLPFPRAFSDTVVGHPLPPPKENGRIFPFHQERPWEVSFLPFFFPFLWRPRKGKRVRDDITCRFLPVRSFFPSLHLLSLHMLPLPPSLFFLPSSRALPVTSPLPMNLPPGATRSIFLPPFFPH